MKNIKNIRLKKYDYSQNSYYFVTICSHLGQPILKDYGKLIENSILSLADIKGVKVDYSVVMDTHIHLVLIFEDCKLSLGEVIRRFKAIVSRKAGVRLWQPNYYEHVIRNENALYKIREYVQNNSTVEKINLSNL